MRRRLPRAIALSLAILALACSGQGGGEKKPSGKDSVDFRQARWGMSQDEVKSTEKSSPTDERPEVITYREDYDGIPALIGYVFEGGKLVSGGYVFMERHEEPGDYIRDYESLKKSLVEEYGKPIVDRVDWKEGEVPEEDPAMFGEAVCSGRLRYLSLWETDTTLLKLTLDRRKDHCQVAIQFESVKPPAIQQTDKGGEPVGTPLP